MGSWTHFKGSWRLQVLCFAWLLRLCLLFLAHSAGHLLHAPLDFSPASLRCATRLRSPARFRVVARGDPKPWLPCVSCFLAAEAQLETGLLGFVRFLSLYYGRRGCLRVCLCAGPLINEDGLLWFGCLRCRFSVASGCDALMQLSSIDGADTSACSGSFDVRLLP